MERHDKHILSDSQEDDEIEDSEHLYIFNNSQNSESNSFKNTIQSNSRKGNKFNFNDIIQINNNEGNKFNNQSLVSSRDLEDLFYDEDRFKKALIKRKEIEEQKKREKGKNIILMINYYSKENIWMEKGMEKGKNIIAMVK